MKKVVLALVFIFSAVTMFAQSAKSEEVTFDYLRLPAQPLEALTGYHFTVNTPYPENNDEIIRIAREKYEREVQNFPAKVAESEILHKEALIEYEKSVVVARENFKIESEQYSKASLAERLILADQGKKPVLRLPGKPSYYKPREPVYYEPNVSRTIIFSPEALIGAHLNLNGFEVKDLGENILSGSIVFYEFEKLDPVQKFKTVSYYDKVSKTNRTRKEYYYQTSYKRATKLELKYNGKILHSGLFESTKEFRVITGPSRPNMVNLERQSINEIMTEVNDYINDLYGFTPIMSKTKVGYIKNKKEEYDDVEEAFNTGFSGYKNYDPNSETHEELEAAIKMWESILQESDLDNKKARVYKKVTKVLLLNLIEANLYTNNVALTKKYIADLEKINLTYTEKQHIKVVKIALEDSEKRLIANKKI